LADTLTGRSPPATRQGKTHSYPLGIKKRGSPLDRDVRCSSDSEGARTSNIDVTETDIDAERMGLNRLLPPHG